MRLPITHFSGSSFKPSICRMVGLFFSAQNSMICLSIKDFYSQPSAFFLRSMPSASSNHDPSSFRPLPETQEEFRTEPRGTRGMERGTPRVGRHANPALYARSRSLKQCATCGRGTRNVFLGSITYRRCSRDLTVNEKKLVLEEQEGALVLVSSWPNLVLRIAGSR